MKTEGGEGVKREDKGGVEEAENELHVLTIGVKRTSCTQNMETKKGHNSF